MNTNYTNALWVVAQNAFILFSHAGKIHPGLFVWLIWTNWEQRISNSLPGQLYYITVLLENKVNPLKWPLIWNLNWIFSIGINWLLYELFFLFVCCWIVSEIHLTLVKTTELVSIGLCLLDISLSSWTQGAQWRVVGSFYSQVIQRQDLAVFQTLPTYTCNYWVTWHREECWACFLKRKLGKKPLVTICLTMKHYSSMRRMQN